MDLKTLNRALLMKFYWQWTKPQQNLWKPLLVHMGLSNELIPAADLFSDTANKILPFWSISVRRIPGNGETISFWGHDWGLGVLKLRFPSLYTYALDTSLTLSMAVQHPNLPDAFRQELSTTAHEQLQELLNDIHSAPTLN